MKLEIVKKPVMTEFVIIDGTEFVLSHLLASISEIMETEENDKYGEYSLRDYELSYHDTMNKLVEMGCVKTYTGPRQAHCYCLANEKGLAELRDAIYELCD